MENKMENGYKLSFVKEVYEGFGEGVLSSFRTNRFCNLDNQSDYISPKEFKAYRKHVDAIKADMVKFGETTNYHHPLFDRQFPIIVYRDKKTGKLIIKDGQHRCAAAIELGIPYYFEIDDCDFTDADGIKISDNEYYAREMCERSNSRSNTKTYINKYNLISSAARGGNEIAQFICDCCDCNNFKKMINDFNCHTEDVSTDVVALNESSSLEVLLGNKMKNVSYIEYYNNNKSQLETIKSMIKTHRDVSIEFAKICCDYGSITDEMSKRKANIIIRKVNAMLRQKTFNKAIAFLLLKANISLDLAKDNADNNKCGKQNNIDDYLRYWGVVK